MSSAGISLRTWADTPALRDYVQVLIGDYVVSERVSVNERASAL